ncbi:hypothetical protein [Moraxella nonliquefaciens]|uniref:hypothetical protein n=1 Tax=Moraxella nonliquefaciens TaxID=478 RepID=UPI001EF6A71B|nr:hypothetical protein [Moraxella nonliquefaciens]MCG7412064.1 hypothetical protein [Moraxella nonliquefaciens]
MCKIFEQMSLEQLILLVEQKKAEPKTLRHAVIIERHINEMEAVILRRQAHLKDDAEKV